MRRRRAVLLLLVAVLAGGVAWRVRRDPEVAPGGGVDEGEAAPDAPPLAEAPVLSAAPPRPPSRRALSPTDGTEADPVVHAPVLGGPLTIRIEPPSPPDGTRARHLRLAARDGDVLDRGSPKETLVEGRTEPVTQAVPGEPTVEWLVPDLTSREPVPTWRVLDLPVGEWLVRAVAPPEDARPPRSWGPVLVRVGPDAGDVTLPLASDATHGRLRLSATQGQAPASVEFHLSWRGVAFAIVPAAEGGGVIDVPAGEDVVVRPAPGRGLGPVAPRTVRVAAGEVEEVVFELPPLVAVRFTALRPGGEPFRQAAFAVWRTTEGGPQPVFHDREDGNGGLATTLSPGDYHVLVTEVRPFAPVWEAFRIAPEAGPQTVEIRLEPTGPEATVLVQRADGAAADGYGLWLGRLDGPSPRDAVTALVVTDPEGRARFGPLPDGEYLVADYGHSVWRTVRVETGRVEPAVLRFPPDSGAAGGAHLRGRVRGPSGERVVKGLVGVGRPDDWRRYTHFTDGRFDLMAPEGEVVLTVHHTWFEADRFAPWSRTVVVEADKDQFLDVRLRPR